MTQNESRHCSNNRRRTLVAKCDCTLVFGLSIIAGLGVHAARAGEAPASAAADKSGFTLFNPTPRPLLRELNTDRPDVTESPITVDAGHIQVEASFVEYTHDRTGAVRSDTLSILPANIKLGLTNNVDLQLVFEPFIRQKSRTGGGGTERLDGFGDTQLRLKVNFWGNDGGDTAFGLMPFIQLPTASDDLTSGHVEGGLIVPFSAKLPGEFEIGMMAGVDVVRDERNEGYGAEFIHTVTVSRKLVGELEGYVEYVGVSPIDTGEGYLAYFSTGLTFGLTDDIQLDGGLLLGLSDAAEDYTVFAGISIRL